MEDKENLLDYLEKLEVVLNKLTKEELSSLLLKLARNFSKNSRSHLTKMINDIRKPIKENKAPELWPEEYREEYKKIRNILKEIESDEIYIIEKEDLSAFEYQSNYYYEEDYWPTYIDDRNFKENFDIVIDFLNKIYSNKYYYRAYILGLDLLELQVEYVYFTDICDEFSLYALEKKQSVSVGFDSILLTTLKAAYLKNNNNVDRSKSITKVYKTAGVTTVSLITLFQEIPVSISEFRTFIKCLITYLKKDNGEIANELLKEANNLIK